MTETQGRIQPVKLVVDISVIYYLVVKSYNSFTAVREMKYTLQHCYDKTMDDRMSFANAVFRMVQNYGG